MILKVIFEAEVATHTPYNVHHETPCTTFPLGVRHKNGFCVRKNNSSWERFSSFFLVCCSLETHLMQIFRVIFTQIKNDVQNLSETPESWLQKDLSRWQTLPAPLLWRSSLPTLCKVWVSTAQGRGVPPIWRLHRMQGPSLQSCKQWYFCVWLISACKRRMRYLHRITE